MSDNRVIFMLKDGAMAWDIKDFLVNQERCEEVTIEGKNYPGKVLYKGIAPLMESNIGRCPTFPSENNNFFNC